MKASSNKVALVTGGASGIGLAIVKRLAANNVKVVVADINEEKLHSLESEYKGNVIRCLTDVTGENPYEAKC